MESHFKRWFPLLERSLEGARAEECCRAAMAGFMERRRTAALLATELYIECHGQGNSTRLLRSVGRMGLVLTANSRWELMGIIMERPRTVARTMWARFFD